MKVVAWIAVIVLTPGAPSQGGAYRLEAELVPSPNLCVHPGSVGHICRAHLRVWTQPSLYEVAKKSAENFKLQNDEFVPHKRTEAELRDTEDHYPHMVKLNPQIAWVLDVAA